MNETEEKEEKEEERGGHNDLVTLEEKIKMKITKMTGKLLLTEVKN